MTACAQRAMRVTPDPFEAVVIGERPPAPPDTHPRLDMTMMSLFFGGWWVRERASPAAPCDDSV